MVITSTTVKKNGRAGSRGSANRFRVAAATTRLGRSDNNTERCESLLSRGKIQPAIRRNFKTAISLRTRFPQAPQVGMAKTVSRSTTGTLGLLLGKSAFY
jgi:hypothetical protein